MNKGSGEDETFSKKQEKPNRLVAFCELTEILVWFVSA